MRTLILPEHGCHRPGETLNSEENQKAVDQASQVASAVEKGSRGKGSAAGLASGSGRQSEGQVGVTWIVKSVCPTGGLQLRSIWSCSQASREKQASQTLMPFPDCHGVTFFFNIVQAEQ